MLQTPRSYGGMVTSPHHLASQAGLRVLHDGGTAIEAMIAAAAVIAVVYPHMNALGGDNFWLIADPGKPPFGIDACGGAAGLADIDFYSKHGHTGSIPPRGPLAALTMAGAVSGWAEAFKRSRGRMPLSRLLEDAIHHAKDGVAVTQTLAENIAGKREQLINVPGWAPVFDGLVEGERQTLDALAQTLEQLAHRGLDDFYRGDLARSMATDLAAAQSPLRLDDFERHQALIVDPLAIDVRRHQVFNMPPPTQGLASLMLLGVFDRIAPDDPAGFDFIHRLVEATKEVFKVRDSVVTDPAYMARPAADYLAQSRLDQMASAIRPDEAAPWPAPVNNGDTVWLGAIDRDGRAVSMIQSLYWEFGSGLILKDSGIMWQNRGTSFSLDPRHHNHLRPHRRPFHTIQPAMALLKDGRHMVYGTMGGEGQPQTQAMIFARHVLYGMPLQQAVNAPRWLLGRTWGEATTNLKLEARFDPAIAQALRLAGHDLEIVGDFDGMMGHAGAIIRHPSGLLEGAADPRSDGSVAAR